MLLMNAERKTQEEKEDFIEQPKNKRRARRRRKVVSKRVAKEHTKIGIDQVAPQEQAAADKTQDTAFPLVDQHFPVLSVPSKSPGQQNHGKRIADGERSAHSSNANQASCSTNQWRATNRFEILTQSHTPAEMGESGTNQLQPP